MSLAQRKPVKATYAHKRGRTTATERLPSPKGSSQEEIPPSEMSRKTLKRSHHSDLSQERTSKKLKPALDACGTSDTTAMTIVDFVQFDLNDSSQFQTPYPSAATEQFKLDSSVGQPLPPEKFSPLPAARRIFSRTSSRNLKENLSRSSRPLASPFHSRPGSVASSPKGKTKNNRRPLISSRTLSDNKTQNDAPEEPTFSVTQSTQISPLPSKIIPRDRRPSVPNPAQMLQQIPHQDWLVPPKALSRSRASLTECNSVFGSPTELGIGSFSFLDNFPQAASTPHHKRTTSDILNQCIVSEVASDIFHDDVTMLDNTHIRTPERKSHFPSCSNMSTIPPRQPSLSVQDSSNGISAPNGFKLVSLGNYDLAFPHLMRSPGTEDSIISPTRPVHRPIPLPSLDSSPDVFSNHLPLDPFIDSSLTHPWSYGDNLSDHDPVLATPPSSPPKTPDGHKLQDMFSVLDIDESSNTTSTDEEPIHDSGIGIPRSRSLDCSTEIMNKKEKSARTRTRDRRGTIRASDYMQKEPINNNVPILTRRTRSGTVIGPAKPSNSTSTSRYNKIDRPASSVTDILPPLSDGDSEDELLLKSHWCRDFSVPDKTAVGRASVGPLLLSRANESDDDLLLKAEKI